MSHTGARGTRLPIVNTALFFRDIKPENVLIEGESPDPLNFDIRLIDFGSAIDEFSMLNYYGKRGPSDKEQTREYAPPEALFDTSITCHVFHA